MFVKKDGLARTALNPAALMTALPRAFASKASVYATVTLAVRTARSLDVQVIALTGGCALMASVFVRKPLLERTARWADV